MEQNIEISIRKLFSIMSNDLLGILICIHRLYSFFIIKINNITSPIKLKDKINIYNTI